MVFMRPVSHEIDTAACRIVPNAFPRTWVNRDIGGRDYGIDMAIEIFDQGRATGKMLLLQIKGTERDIEALDSIDFDVPVNTLKYSELFIVPFLLIICPVNSTPLTFFYIWLQEYIKVVLNFENPDWRDNHDTVRVHLPKTNHMPGNENRLSFLANFPSRLFGLAYMARIIDEINHELDGEPLPDSYQFSYQKLLELTTIPGLFDDPSWEKANFYKDQYLIPAIAAAELLSQEREYSREEVLQLKMFQPPDGMYELVNRDDIDYKYLIQNQLTHSLEILLTLLDEVNYSFKHTMWQAENFHSY
jgi:hypothetical protein